MCVSEHVFTENLISEITETAPVRSTAIQSMHDTTQTQKHTPKSKKKEESETRNIIIDSRKMEI